MNRKPYFQIRKHVYRHREGFLILNCGSQGWGERIFVESRVVAEHIKEKLMRGENLTMADYEITARELIAKAEGKGE